MAWHSGVQTLTPKADPAPGSHTQCCRKGIGAVCKVVQGAGLLNPAKEGQEQFGEEEAREACTAPVDGFEFVVVAVFSAAAAGSSAAAGSGAAVVAVEVSAVAGSVSSAAAAGSAVACAAGPVLLPYSQSGQRAHDLDLLPAFGPGPAASSAVAGGTTNHT